MTISVVQIFLSALIGTAVFLLVWSLFRIPLHAEIPAHLRLKRRLALPEPILSEHRLRRHVEALLGKNRTRVEASLRTWLPKVAVVRHRLLFRPFVLVTTGTTTRRSALSKCRRDCVYSRRHGCNHSRRRCPLHGASPCAGAPRSITPCGPCSSARATPPWLATRAATPRR